jgi:DNA processing protein
VTPSPSPGAGPDREHVREDRAQAEQEALLVLRALPGVGDRILHRGLRGSASAAEVLSGGAEGFRSRFGERAERARHDPALFVRARTTLSRCRQLGIEVLTWSDPGYPDSLRDLFDPPSLLFLQGRRGLLGARPAVSVVGSRRPTPYGLRTARDLAGEWAAAGYLVISGLAMGVDASAHEGALERGGPTVAVLGSGPDRPGPVVNRRLAGRIRREGLLVSEFPPGERARPHHFPRRNRILAALADAVVVVEASASSGALITVDHALDLGREVLAVPGPIDRAQSRGANRLIREGASPVLEPEDLLNALGTNGSTSTRGPAEAERVMSGATMGAGLLTYLCRGPLSSQEIQVLTDADSASLQVALAEAEILGLIRLDHGHRWTLTPSGRRRSAGPGGTIPRAGGPGGASPGGKGR